MSGEKLKDNMRNYLSLTTPNIELWQKKQKLELRVVVLLKTVKMLALLQSKLALQYLR
jgi:hypothetical protein